MVTLDKTQICFNHCKTEILQQRNHYNSPVCEKWSKHFHINLSKIVWYSKWGKITVWFLKSTSYIFGPINNHGEANCVIGPERGKLAFGSRTKVVLLLETEMQPMFEKPLLALVSDSKYRHVIVGLKVKFGRHFCGLKVKEAFPVTKQDSTEKSQHFTVK